MRPTFSVCLATTALLCFSGPSVASDNDDLGRARSETVYAPAYSRIHTHTRNRQALASTLVVHNVDPKISIELISIRYHDREGKLIREFLEAPATLQPFQSENFLTQMSETAGGVGANYIVEWRSADCALSPAVETVMIGGSGTHGISFTSAGRVIAREIGGACE